MLLVVTAQIMHSLQGFFFFFVWLVGFFVLFFWLQCTTCGILLPLPGIKPTPPAVEVHILNHWNARETVIGFINVCIFM